MQYNYMRVLGVALSLALVGVMSSVAWADRGHGGWAGGHAVGKARHGMYGHGGATSHLLRYLLRHQTALDLSDEQIAKLKTLALDQDRTRIRARAAVQVAERELRALMWDEKAELSAIETKIKERQALAGTLRFAGIKARRELVAVLTPEQREKLRSLYGRMRQSHHGRNFSSQGAEAADHGKVVDGSPAEPEIGLHEPDEHASAG
jgi:periplasmic protein CpxP/Spy